jgi:hypothetical protein
MRRSLRDFANDAAGIAPSKHALGNVAYHHATSADDRFRSNPHAWQDDRASGDPQVWADLYRLPEILTPPQLGIEWMHGRVDLHRRTEQREATDLHRAAQCS